MTNHITKLIENSGKKLTEISEATNIAYPTLSGYNQGIRKPKKDNAEKLAKYFNVSVAYIMGLDSNPHAPSNLKIVTDSFKTSKIGSVTPFKSDMEKLKKSIEFGERALTLPLDDSFSDEFRHIFSEYLSWRKTNRFYVWSLWDYMNHQNKDSKVWQSWIKTDEYAIRQEDRKIDRHSFLNYISSET